MITNRMIKLDKNSQERIDAKNTIKYTLLLDYKEPEYKDDETFINNIFYECNDCCYSLFRSKSYISKGKYDFFGMNYKINFNPNSVLTIDKYPNPEEYKKKPESFSEFSINNSILQHCIVKCYHAIMTELNDEKKATYYSIVNSQHLKSPLNYTKPTNNTEKSRIASDIKKKSETHLRAMPFFENLALNPVFSELWFQVCYVNSTRFSNIFLREKREKLDLKSIINNIRTIFNELAIGNKQNIDSLYYNYLVERVFNFHLFISIIETILFVHSTNTKYRLDQTELLSTISKIELLPNVFSRQIFLMYGLFHVIESNNYNSYRDFWTNRDLTKDDADPISSTRLTKRTFDLYLWKEQFYLFTMFLSDYFIPIHEWCFTCMMFDALEKRFPNESHKEHLNRAKISLENFVLKNYDLLINPYKHSKINIKNINSNMYDSVSEINEIYNLSDLSENAIVELINDFFSSDKNIDLNLSSNLNPEYFKANPRNLINPSTERIMKFYLDLLRYNYWEPR